MLAMISVIHILFFAFFWGPQRPSGVLWMQKQRFAVFEAIRLISGRGRGGVHCQHNGRPECRFRRAATLQQPTFGNPRRVLSTMVSAFKHLIGCISTAKIAYNSCSECKARRVLMTQTAKHAKYSHRWHISLFFTREGQTLTASAFPPFSRAWLRSE